MHQVEAVSIVWNRRDTDLEVYAQIELALEIQYFTNAWLQGKLGTADYLEYAEWRNVDLVRLLARWERLGRFEL